MTAAISAVRDGERRTVVAGIDQLALRSATLPPYRHTWLTLIRSGSRGVLIDPGFRTPSDVEQIRDWLRERGASDVDRILISHTHRDHVDGLAALCAELGDVPVHVHPLERERLPADVRTVPLGDARLLVVGGSTIRAHHTPGHAPGHLVFEVAPCPDPHASPGPSGLIVGDLITARGAPWVGLPEGSVDRYLDSIAKARALHPRWLAPAHGDVPIDPEAALIAADAQRRRRRDRTYASLHAPMQLADVVEAVYGPVDEEAFPMVRAATLANLLSLMRARRIVHLGSDEEGPYQQAPGST